MSRKQKSLAIACGMVIAVLAGCDQDEIRRYQVTRVESPTKHAGSQRPAAQRMLGAIIPREDQTWFFKLAGARQDLEQHKEAFEQFVRSVHFEENGTIAWTVPDGWRSRPTSAARYATFHVGPEESPLELTVTPLPSEGDAASVLKNVNRWRGQLGLQPIDEAALDQVTRRVELDGITATLVDITGPGALGRGPVPSDKSRAAAPQPPLRHDVPDGWEPQSDPGPFSVSTFLIRDGSRQAKVTISPLGGGGGNLLENVNRWRNQIGLQPMGEDQLLTLGKKIEVAGGAGHYFDLIGPESAGERRQRILGVVAARGEQTWFFKMIGPADLVGKQKAAFEAFLQSVKFE